MSKLLLMKMIRVIIGLVLVGSVINGRAQSLEVTDFHEDLSDTYALQYPKEDYNGDRCGLIRLGLSMQTLADPIFEGDIIYSKYNNGEWLIYMPKDSNWLIIKSKDGSCLPLRYEFEGIKSNVTYIMNVESTVILTEIYNKKGDQYFLNKDYDNALGWYKKAADLGSAEGQNVIGFMYLNGYGVDKDYAVAMKYFKLSAEQGNKNAQTFLAVMYREGLGIEKANYSEALKWMSLAANQGYDRAQYFMGTFYFQGKGVDKDYSEALKWFLKAGDQGYAESQYFLGVLYELGLGVDSNLEEAANWYRKAAEQGNDDAKKRLKAL